VPMPVARLELDFTEASGVHRVRNLGVDLCRAFGNDRLVSIDLADVDRAAMHLRIDLFYASKSRLKQVRDIVGEVVAKHLMTKEARITILDLGADD
jgi:hypothetical protein